MLAVHRILVPTGHGPCAVSAYAAATRLATAFGADLHVVCAEAIAASTMNDLEVTLPPPPEGVRVVEATAPGDTVTEALLRYAEAADIDLIVMGTHGLRGLAHTFLGSVAEEVVRGASCPVLVVRAEPAAGEAPCAEGLPPVRRILVPVDFSTHSEAALRHAAALAETFGAQVDLLHATEVPLLPEYYGVLVEAASERLAQRHQALRGLLERFVPEPRRGRTFVEVGPPAPAILDTLREHDLGLGVMGTHGRTGLRRLALGSVAERVVRLAPCDVWVVRPPAKSLHRPEGD